MSQHEFGQLLEVASTTIASLELGRTKTISEKVAKAIAEIFEIAPKEIRQKYEAWLEEKRKEQLRKVRRLRGGELKDKDKDKDKERKGKERKGKEGVNLI